ncbi:MAG: D-aminoacyl-tRNA deacylase [Actinomycetota bacterium]
MRLVVQRVSSASVTVGDERVASVGPGLLVLAGVARDDAPEGARRLAQKVAHLRIFGDDEGKMNRCLVEVGGEALVVSQFTLYGDTRKGHRPSFVEAARPEVAVPVLAAFLDELTAAGVPVQEGRFQAHMQVQLVNDGPVTIVMEG